MDRDTTEILRSAATIEEVVQKVREIMPTSGPELQLLMNNTSMTRTYAAQVKKGESGPPRIKLLTTLVEHFAPGYTLGVVPKRPPAS